MSGKTYLLAPNPYTNKKLEKFYKEVIDGKRDIGLKVEITLTDGSTFKGPTKDRLVRIFMRPILDKIPKWKRPLFAVKKRVW